MSSRVVSLHIYPVKSCAGIEVDSFKIGNRGPEHDREWMIVDETNNQFLTQRILPELAQVKTSLTSSSLVLSIPGKRGGTTEIAVPRAAMKGTKVDVQCWSFQSPADEMAPLASHALSDFLGRPVRFVRMSAETERKLPEGTPFKAARLGFVDSAPLLMTTTGSLNDLNKRLETPVPMSRFRPNIVIESDEAYAEDSWLSLKIGAVEFDFMKPCARCVIVNTDQDTGSRGGQPLKTLATYRKDAKFSVNFGVYLVHQYWGTLKKGDPVVLTRI